MNPTAIYFVQCILMGMSSRKKSTLSLILSILTAYALLPGWVDAQDRMLGLIEREIGDIAQEVESSIVSVYADVPLSKGSGRIWNVGSGVVLDSVGHVVTMNRVIYEAKRIEVIFRHGRQYPGRCVGRDRETGIAVLHVQGEDMRSPSFGNSDRIKVGEWVFLIGNHMGLISPSFGLIHGFRPERGLLQLNVPLSPGNTGAPIFDRRGRVLGIVAGELLNTPDIASSARSLNSEESGVSLAVPINTVRQVARELIARDHSQCGWLGIEGIFNPPPIGIEGIQVLNVINVIKDSPADKAGVLKDDIIVEYNERPIRDAMELVEEVQQMPLGTPVRLKIKRGNEYKVLTIQVGRKSPISKRK